MELKKYIIYRDRFVQKNRLIDSNFAIDHNLIFINAKGKCMPSNTIDRRWRKFRKNNNISNLVRIHDLRRYYATFLIKNNIPDKIVKSLLGHSDINMTAYYQNDDIKIAQTLMSKIDLNL